MVLTELCGIYVCFSLTRTPGLCGRLNANAQSDADADADVDTDAHAHDRR